MDELLLAEHMNANPLLTDAEARWELEMQAEPPVPSERAQNHGARGREAPRGVKTPFLRKLQVA